LAAGHAGIALLCGYAALAEPSPRKSQRLLQAHQHLERAVDLLGQSPNNPWLFSGFSGVAWVVDHFLNMGLLEDSGDELNEEVDGALMEFLSWDPWTGQPELIAGVAGLGLYGLDRAGRGRGSEIASRAVEILLQKAEQTRHGLAWFVPPEELYPLALRRHPKGLFNLGVSHGNPGVTGFLAEAAFWGNTGARAMLDSSMGWLLACRAIHSDHSLYGMEIGRDGRLNERGSRLSWCYGDLGVSIVLLLAARHTGNPLWETEALAVARACATRPDSPLAIKDAGLCHGAMGNAHLFSRLYNATGETCFLDRARAFYEQGLDIRRDGEAGGFMAFHPPLPEEPPRDPWVPDTGLLEGAVGIGLALLAGTTTIEPLWDRHLLAHVAPQWT
jgi:lantibiotic modifying enzyme